MQRSFRSPGVLAGLFLFCIIGCGSTATVTGQATYEGEPIKDGWINFLPADGKGVEAAAPITNGRYTVTKMMPGPKIVLITAVKDVPFARSSEEMAKRAAEAKAKGDATGIIDPADIIAPDAVGNNAKLDIQDGTHTHDFALKKAAKK